MKFLGALQLALIFLTTEGCRPARWEPCQREIEGFEIPNPFLIEITGSKKNWFAHYSGQFGRLTSVETVSGGSEIHVPLGTKLVFLLKSNDYVYTFSIPACHLKEIAVPGLEFRMEFKPAEIMQLDLVGEQLCGEPHTAVAGRLVVESQEKFLEWHHRIH